MASAAATPAVTRMKVGAITVANWGEQLYRQFTNGEQSEANGFFTLETLGAFLDHCCGWDGGCTHAGGA